MLDPYYEEKQRRRQQIKGDERDESIRSIQGEAKAQAGCKDAKKHVSYLVGRRTRCQIRAKRSQSTRRSKEDGERDEMPDP